MSKEHYMHTCEVVDASTIVCQGMKFIRQHTCKECNHFIEEGYSHCNLHHHLCNHKDFCSWFTRKEKKNG